MSHNEMASIKLKMFAYSLLEIA